jgi:hypothetical protein
MNILEDRFKEVNVLASENSSFLSKPDRFFPFRILMGILVFSKILIFLERKYIIFFKS